MVTATRTINPLHFEDLEPHRFEDLARQLIYDFRNWSSIEAIGRSGSDEGIDIRATEKTPTAQPTLSDDDDRSTVFSLSITLLSLRRVVLPRNEVIPKENQAWYKEIQIISFDRILAVDEIGDAYNEPPHLLVEYREGGRPFEDRVIQIIESAAPSDL